MIKITNYADLTKYFDIPAEAIAFLQGMDENTANGRHEFTPDCYVNVMETTTREALADMEAHEIFVDVQCLIRGEEKILVADKTNLPVTVAYDAAKEASFHSFTAAEAVTYKAGEGVVLYPNEAHLPCLAVHAPMAIKKAVMKVNFKKLAKNV